MEAVTSTFPPILDDQGLLRLLGLPAETDLARFRKNSGLPYTMLRPGNQPIYRYVTAEVIRWMVDRQTAKEG